MRNRNVQLNWNSLLEIKRLAYNIAENGTVNNVTLVESHDSGITTQTESERDYCRTVYSNSFRRLARKTQVHPFAPVDYVRNRLTHSLEVSTVAYSIFREVINDKTQPPQFNNDQVEKIGWVLRTAGLAHDLGNPPYGHAGEAAIRAWAKKLSKGEKRLLGDSLKDFECYDGNAQAFRLLSRTRLDNPKFLWLSLASIGAIVKYPLRVSRVNPTHPKFGSFCSEYVLFDVVMGKLGLRVGKGGYLRHPLAFILEAADDICYLLSDFDDAVKLGIMSADEVKGLYADLLAPEAADAVKGKLQELRTMVAGFLIKVAAAAFVKGYDKIMTGSMGTKSLIDDLAEKGVRDRMKTLQSKRRSIFQDYNTLLAEVSGYSEITKYLTNTLGILRYVGFSKKAAEIPFFEKHLIGIIFGEDYFELNRSKNREWWAHAILDYLVGMTDDYLRTFAKSM